eukprot:gene1014-1144_t
MDFRIDLQATLQGAVKITNVTDLDFQSFSKDDKPVLMVAVRLRTQSKESISTSVIGQCFISTEEFFDAVRRRETVIQKTFILPRIVDARVFDLLKRSNSKAKAQGPKRCLKKFKTQPEIYWRRHRQYTVGTVSFNSSGSNFYEGYDDNANSGMLKMKVRYNTDEDQNSFG